MQYLIVTSRGYWGKAKTAIEAARNASVGGTYVDGYMLRLSDKLAEKLYCSGMGGWGFTYTDPLMDALKIPKENGPKAENQWVLDAIQEMGLFEKCGFVIIKGKLRVTLIEE
jgi:hypothetical protein